MPLKQTYCDNIKLAGKNVSLPTERAQFIFFFVEGDEEEDLPDEDLTKKDLSLHYHLSNIFGESSLIMTNFRAVFHPNFKKLEDVFYEYFSRDKLHFFESSHEWYFEKSTRERIMDFLLKRKRFSDSLEDDFAFGIARLIKLGVYSDAYPVHDGSLEDEGNQLYLYLLAFCLCSESDRCKLYQGWGRFANWYKFQPLDAIRKYYGVKIALYFAWLGFFTKMLIIPSIVGLVVFIYGFSR